MAHVSVNVCYGMVGSHIEIAHSPANEWSSFSQAGPDRALMHVLTSRKYSLPGEFPQFLHQVDSQSWNSSMPVDARILADVVHSPP